MHKVKISLKYNFSIDGQVAQLVEQRIENPRVGGSIPSLATTNSNRLEGGFCLSTPRKRKGGNQAPFFIKVVASPATFFI